MINYCLRLTSINNEKKIFYKKTGMYIDWEQISSAD